MSRLNLGVIAGLIAGLHWAAGGASADAIPTLDSLRSLVRHGCFATAHQTGCRLLERDGARGDSGAVADDIEALLETTRDRSAPVLPRRIDLARRCVRIRASGEGEARALAWLGRCLGDVGRLGDARDTLERALAIAKQSPGDADIAQVQFELAVSRAQTGNAAGALTLANQAVTAWRTAARPDSAWLGWPLTALADWTPAADATANARLLAFRRGTVADIERQHPCDSLALAEACRLLARDERTRARRIAVAETLYQRAYDLRRRHVRGDPADAAMMLAGVAACGELRGDVAVAAATWRRMMALAAASPTPDSAGVAWALSQGSDGLFRCGDFPAAESCYATLGRLRERLLGSNVRETADAVYMQGLSARRMDDYVTARPLLERALMMRERLLPPDDVDVGRSYSELGNSERLMNDNAPARRDLEHAIPILEKRLGEDNMEVANAVRNLGLALRNSGDLVGARAPLERALRIAERVVGPVDPSLVLYLTGVGVLMHSLRQFEAAESLYTRALRILEARRNPDDPGLIDPLNDMASLLADKGRPDQAISYLERVVRVSQKAYGQDWDRLPIFLMNEASTLTDLGQLDRARDVYEQAIATARRSAGPDSYWEGEALGGLAWVMARNGDSAGGVRQLQHALVIEQRVLGDDHPYVGYMQSELAYVALLARDSASAFENAIRSDRIRCHNLQLGARGLSEREALQLGTETPDGLNAALSLCLTSGRAGQASACFEALVRSRATVLDEVARRHRQVADIGAHAREFAEASAAYAKLALGGADDDPKSYRHRVDVARARQDQAERALAGAGDRDLELASPPDAARLALALPAGSTLVSYARYDRWVAHTGLPAKVDSIPSYVAFVLSSDAREPRVIPIGPALTVDSLITEWRRLVSRPESLLEPPVGDAHAAASSVAHAGQRMQLHAATVNRAVGVALRRALWDPLADALHGADRVFVVPDGPLSLISIATLPAGDDGYVIEQRPVIHYLNTERDLLAPAPSSAARGLLAFGGPDYDRADTRAGAIQLAAATSDSAAATFRGRRSSCADFNSLRWLALPGAARECRVVAELWKAAADSNLGRESQMVSGAAASEAAFKVNAPGHRVLHLATHGFFLDDRCGRRAQHASVLSSGPSSALDQSDVTIESPLVRSGLVLAGANRRQQVRPGEDDGVLTAEEVAAMDLSGCEWAVLSACETGVGEVRAGEGVFGLRRAFQVAGARTVIMSLWSVDDESTRAWMTSLYEGRLKRGLDTSEAVREASLAVLKQRRAAGLDTHPFYWGAFVAAGGWQ